MSGPTPPPPGGHPATTAEPTARATASPGGPVAGSDARKRVAWRLWWEMLAATAVLGAPFGALVATICWVDFGLQSSSQPGCPDRPGFLAAFPAVWLALLAWRGLSAQRRLGTTRPDALERFRQIGLNHPGSARENALALFCLLLWLAGLLWLVIRFMGDSWLRLIGVAAIVGVAVALAALSLRVGIPHVHRFSPVGATPDRCETCDKPRTSKDAAR